MRQRLMVTGYGGFVAGSVVWQASETWDVHALSLVEAPEMRDGFRCYQLDLRDTAKLREVFRKAKPNAVIHTAALADIDYCQSHQDEAEEVNVGITQELARLCGESGARLALCSTDSIFDGAKGMYTEEEEPRPINTYADTKVRAEKIVLEECGGGVVARLSLVMGLPVLGAGNSFLAKMIASLEAGREVLFPQNEVRTPVDVITVGRVLLELAGSTFTGTLHVSGNTRLNRYDMAQRIAERLGYSAALVTPTDSNAIEGRAPRPNDASLDNARAKSLLDTPMRSLMEGLELVLAAKEGQSRE
jgi:dTDP-4-dehydrorhamnose reductase